MAKQIDWDFYYNAFPVNKKYIWLNNCGAAPASQFVLDAMQQYLTSYAQEGYEAADYPYNQVKTEIQEILARLLNTEPSSIALLHNTAEGMNLVSQGLSLQPGDQILLLEDEYPSNVYPWQHWQEKGVTLTFIPLAETPAAFLEHVQSHITNNTRVIALSAVHWCTGMPLPLRDIAHLCREQDILLAVDGAQGIGHVPIDVDGWRIPFVAFSCWKWLLGPLGLGCLVIPRWALHYTKPLFKGPDAVPDSTHYLPYKQQWKQTAERYMYSTANFMDWIYFRASLRMLDAIGCGEVRQRLYRLAGYLGKLLQAQGFRVLADKFSDNQQTDIYCTAVIAAEKTGLDAGRAADALKKQQIIARERKGRIRLAPHIYNSFEQLERVAEILGTL